jgi:hypothetical protein
MMQQFFGKNTWIAFGVIIGFWLLGLIGYFSAMGLWILLGVFIAVFSISLKRLDYGVYLAFLELFSSPHGQLISTELEGFTFSLRMCVFMAVLMAWFFGFVTKRYSRSIDVSRLYWFLPLGMAVLIGFIVGYAHNGFSATFSDGNAYLYLVYLFPILSLSWNVERKKILLQLLTAGALSVSFFSLGVLYLFSHFDTPFLKVAYTVLRDLRFAEITNIGTGVYRIFSQTQFFVVTFIFLLIALSLQVRSKFYETVSWSMLFFSTIFLGLSRSFWVGFFVAFLGMVALLALKVRPHLTQWGHATLQYVGGIILAIGLILAVALFPVPTQDLSGADFAEAFSKRTQTDDVAVSSRWNLLHPMMEHIAQNPWYGSGFGTAVTFISDDPRVREVSEDGTWSTVSMEWGWLEVWIKMGVMGPVGLLFIFFFYLKHLLTQEDQDHLWLRIALISGLLFLFTTHFFSPYLNHPIGLGFLLFCFPFLSEKQNVPAVEQERVPLTMKAKQMVPVTIQTDEL